MSDKKPFLPSMFESMVGNMTEGIVVSLPDSGVIVYANAFFETLFGYGDGELAGKHLSVLGEFEESGWHGLVSAIRSSILDTGCWQEEVKHRRKDGTWFWCSDNASIFADEQYGELLLLVQRDITAQKAVQDALEESERLRKQAQRLTLIGHWRLNLNTNHLFGTDELYAIFDLPKGSPLSDFDLAVHPDDRESTAEMMQATLANRGRYDSTYRLITSTGSRKWVHAIAEGMFDQNGSLYELAGSVQDITALKLAENELQKMQKLQSLGVMAGGIAHDFNNINTLLFGSISLAKSRMAADHPGFADLEIAEKALQRAVNLSNQLLTFAKGGEPLKKNIDLKKLIEEVTKLDLTGTNIKLDFASAPDLWRVDADAGQMEQVFTNLAINACQAMPRGGILHIQLDNARFEAGNDKNIRAGKYAVARVKDDGEGIPDETLPKIFDPYFSTKKTGSGLGLATAYSIVKKHGGYIDVASKVGKGTTFYIYLPAAELQNTAASFSGHNRAGASSGRVLVMDDEKELCELVRKILATKGYAVELAYDGAQAIAMYRQAMAQSLPFDCTIMDLTIPGGIGGKEAIREILLLDPKAKAIVSSGYAEDPVMASFGDYGFKGVIPKPYTPAMLVQVVQEVIAHK